MNQLWTRAQPNAVGMTTSLASTQSGGVHGGADPPAFTKGRKKEAQEAARRQVRSCISQSCRCKVCRRVSSHTSAHQLCCLLLVCNQPGCRQLLAVVCCSVKSSRPARTSMCSLLAGSQSSDMAQLRPHMNFGPRQAELDVEQSALLALSDSSGSCKTLPSATANMSHDASTCVLQAELDAQQSGLLALTDGTDSRNGGMQPEDDIAADMASALVAGELADVTQVGIPIGVLDRSISSLQRPYWRQLA